MDSVLDDLIGKTPKLNEIDANLLLYDVFETVYGIYDHINTPKVKRNPFSSVLLHVGEDNSSTSQLYEQIDLFMDSDIHKQTGLNLNEFFALPRERVRHILMKNRRSAISNNTEASNAIATVEASMKR